MGDTYYLQRDLEDREREVYRLKSDLDARDNEIYDLRNEIDRLEREVNYAHGRMSHVVDDALRYCRSAIDELERIERPEQEVLYALDQLNVVEGVLNNG